MQITRAELILAEQSKILYGNFSYASLGNALFSAAVIWLNGGLFLIPNIIWGGIMLLVTLSYIGLWYQWRRTIPEPSILAKWQLFPIPVTVLSGLGWGWMAGYQSPFGGDGLSLLIGLATMIAASLTVLILAPVGRLVAIFLGSSLTSLAVTVVSLGKIPVGTPLLLLLTAIAAITITGIILSLLFFAIARLRAGKLNASGKLFQAREKMSGLHNQLTDGDERRRDVERELMLSKEAAESANMAKTEFLATMSHEIRTPLNSIVPLLEVLVGSQLNKEQGELANTALNSSLHLISIIDDILNFTKIEAGKLALEAIEIRLKDLVESVTGMMAKSAERRKLELSYKIHPDVPEYIRGDPIRLRQVLTNLVSNAIKFTTEGSIVVEVARRSVRRKEVELIFSVKDTGVGMDKEIQEKLFQSFTQADASTTRKHGGTGLGLVISKRLVELMGGKMGVQSEEGVGSIFFFAIAMRKSLRDAPPERHSLNGVRALIVSDGKEMEVRCKSLFDQWGIVYETADSVIDAMDKLSTTATLGETWVYELVVADVSHLGRRLGSLAREIAKLPTLADLKLVAVGELYEVEGLGKFDGTIPMPIQKNDFNHLLCRVLDVEDRKTRPSGTFDTVNASDRLLLADVEHGQWEGDDESPPEPMDSTFVGRVLVVEDNPVNLRVARKLLQRMGFESDAVADGLQGVKAIESGDYALVLMDCQMPIMDGYQATHEIRLRERSRALPRLPIVAMTANSMAGDREKCLDAGMDDYLSKPILSDTLFAMIKKWLPESAMKVSSQKEAPESEVTPEVAFIPDPLLETMPLDVSSPPREVSDTPPAYGGATLDNEILNELYEVMEGDFLELIETFLESSPELFDEITSALESGDLDGVMRAAHSLKSGSANLGATTLSAAAKNVEFAAREGDVKALDLAGRNIGVAYKAACEALKEVCDRGEP